MDQVWGDVCPLAVSERGAALAGSGRARAGVGASLNADSRVAFAEPNYRYQALGTPNDPNLFQAMGARHDPLDCCLGLYHRQQPVTIAIIDTGVDEGHDDLAGKLVAGHDFVDDDSNPHDTNGHGTHVAGIAAASHRTTRSASPG